MLTLSYNTHIPYAHLKYGMLTTFRVDLGSKIAGMPYRSCLAEQCMIFARYCETLLDMGEKLFFPRILRIFICFILLLSYVNMHGFMNEN